ncbi:tetraspanin-17-like [Neocloeon triangulifer]|uniref:tetraspanin-17-like n=1 Tax=Neocloeon triangulifer TaxID=2078957 RepID=UPI00286EC88C|nr:tetraspanin-17-like [Neocloeon triangulifer]
MATTKLQKTFHVLNILLLASAIAEIVMAAVIYKKVYAVDLLSSLSCGLITFANFAVQIAGFSTIFISWITSEVQHWMEYTIANYYKETFAKNAWDQMQTALSCCGEFRPDDWLFNVNGPIPISCNCENGIDDNCKSGPYFEVGCLSTMLYHVYDLSPTVAALAAAMAVLQGIKEEWC